MVNVDADALADKNDDTLIRFPDASVQVGDPVVGAVAEVTVHGFVPVPSEYCLG